MFNISFFSTRILDIHLRNSIDLVHRSILRLVASLLVRWALEIEAESFANPISAAFACQLMVVEPKVFDLVADSEEEEEKRI